jgi:ribonuclease P protein component
MRSSEDFERTVRRGARAGQETLVVHLVRVTDPGPTGPAVGLVVSKAVGTAVRRNLVKRRLRALVAERLASLPTDVSLVVRALPPAAARSYAGLADDLDGALATAKRRAGVAA